MKEFKTLSWTLDRFENGSAVLLGEAGKITIPRSFIPKHIKEGDAVSAEFFLVKDEQKRRENLAKALLEEILGK